MSIGETLADARRQAGLTVDEVSRAASSSESTSLRAQPSVTRLTVRDADFGGPGRGDTRRAYPRDYVLAPGLKLSVSGLRTFVGCRLPFTVSTIPGGLPSRISTAVFSVHVIEEPAGTMPM